MTETQHRLQQQFPEWPWQFDRPLAESTYFKMGGPAEADITLTTIERIADLTIFCHQQAIPLTVLGGASNVIVDDQGVKGVVLHIGLTEVTRSEQDPSLVQAGAGVKTALLVSQTVEWSLTGLEFFLGVPGTVGGAVYNNAHYLAHLLSEYITRVQVLSPEGELKWLTKAECDFAYDHSRFHTSQEIILLAEFKLPAGDPAASRQLIAEATRRRSSSQPLGLPSSGCIFQNVPNTPELKQRFPQFAQQTHISAGFLIDQAGLKKTRVGQIEVSDKHAAFMINLGGGTSAQTQQLIDLVKAAVKKQLGVELQEEVFYLR